MAQNELEKGTSGRIFVVGAGSMAESFVKGVLHDVNVCAADIRIINRSRPDRLAQLSHEYGVVPAESLADVEASDVVVLSVKPHDVVEALNNLTPWLNGQTLISFAAGIPISLLESASAGRAQVVRTMPNVPVAVLEGVIAVSASPHVEAHRLQQAKHMLASLGTVVELEESLMDAATAFSGSGPGFVSYFLESMEDAAVQLGFSAQVARALLIQTVVGTAKVLEEWRLSPSELRQRVTSPNGTTHSGLTILDEYRVPQAIAEAIRSAAERSREMGNAYQDTARPRVSP